jgi:hypothetical protein
LKEATQATIINQEDDKELTGINMKHVSSYLTVVIRVELLIVSNNI